MEEKVSNLEQPIISSPESQGELFSQVNMGQNETTEKVGSKLGKFKSAESLLDAYNSLQSEYTKKCQALSRLSEEVKTLESKTQTDTLQSLKEKFFEKNAGAKKYEDKLVDIIFKDKVVASSQDPLQSAWEVFSKNNLFTKEELAQDEDFLREYVYGNKDISEKILANYFGEISLKNNPTLISAQKGSQVVLAPTERPKNISEAGKVVMDMLS